MLTTSPKRSKKGSDMQLDHAQGKLTAVELDEKKAQEEKNWKIFKDSYNEVDTFFRNLLIGVKNGTLQLPPRVLEYLNQAEIGIKELHQKVEEQRELTTFMIEDSRLKQERILAIEGSAGEEVQQLRQDKQLLLEYKTEAQLKLQETTNLLTQIDQNARNTKLQLEAAQEQLKQSAGEKVASLLGQIETEQQSHVEELRKVGELYQSQRNEYQESFKEQYNNLLEDKKAREKEYAQDNQIAENLLQDTLRKKREVDEQLNSLKKQLDTSTRRIASTENTTKIKMDNLELNNKNLKEQNESLKNEKQTAESNLDAIRKELRDTQSREQAKAYEIENIARQRDDLRTTLETLKGQSADTFQDLSRQLVDQIEKQKVLQGEKSIISNQLAESTRVNTGLATLIEKHEKESTKMKDELSVSKETSLKNEAVIKKIREENEALLDKTKAQEALLSNNENIDQELRDSLNKSAEEMSALKNSITLLEQAKLEVERALETAILNLGFKTTAYEELQQESLKKLPSDPTINELLQANINLAATKNRVEELQLEVKNAQAETKEAQQSLRELQKDYRTRLIRESSEDGISVDSSAEALIDGVSVFEIDDSGEQIYDMGKSFSPSVHTEVLLYNDSVKQLVSNWLLETARFRALQLYNVKDKDYKSLYKADGLSGMGTEEFGEVFKAIRKEDLDILLDTYTAPVKLIGVPDDLSTKSKKKKKEGLGGGPFLKYGAPVFALNMLDSINQVVWHARLSELNEATPGSFSIEMMFSKGKNPFVGSKEFHLVARKVHLIEDPTGESTDRFYAVDLTSAASVVNVHYIQLGPLVMNTIHGQGSFRYRVISNDQKKVIKNDVVTTNYSFPSDTEREYNTKVMLHPSEDVTFYARDTKSNTFHLETILIKA